MKPFLVVRPSARHPLGVESRSGLLISRHDEYDLGTAISLSSVLFPLLLALLEEETEFRDEVERFSLGGIVKSALKGFKATAKIMNPSLVAGKAFLKGKNPLKALSKSVKEVGAIMKTTAPYAAIIPGYGPLLSTGAALVGETLSPTRIKSQGRVSYTGQVQPSARVRAAAEQYKEVSAAFGPYEGLRFIARELPDVFELFVVMADLTQGLHDISVYATEPGTARDEACVPCGLRLGDWNGRLPEGEFYRSRLVRGALKKNLGQGVFGEVHLSQLPFPLHISANSSEPRATVALAHELAHVANKLYKLPLNHHQVHDLGVFFGTEGFPLYRQFVKHINQN